MSKGRVVVAMSGGVDSSVAAQLLVEQGYDVVGLFMRTGAVEEDHESKVCSTGPGKIQGCCSAVDAADAQRVADRLDIPFYALNFSDEFDRIKDYFVDEYTHGRTPNPCVVCNTWLKFGKLWDYARAIDADWIATGHYARTARTATGDVRLLRGIDRSKDQSYFLFGMAPEILGRVLFPLGELTKPRVREIAEANSLGVHQKRESQEICFVPSGDYKEFLRKRRPDLVEPHGEIVDDNGAVLGRHSGVSGFTIGQRKGLGVAVGEPRYVVRIDDESRRVVIGPKELLLRSSMTVENANWLGADQRTEPFQAIVKIRYLHEGARARIEPAENRRFLVQFDEPQSAITPGQAAVFYDGDRVLGGGWIG